MATEFHRNDMCLVDGDKCVHFTPAEGVDWTGKQPKSMIVCKTDECYTLSGRWGQPLLPSNGWPHRFSVLLFSFPTGDSVGDVGCWRAGLMLGPRRYSIGCSRDGPPPNQLAKSGANPVLCRNCDHHVQVM